MTVRTRLVLAFGAVSVVPLAAVTLYSYSSSVDAFETRRPTRVRDHRGGDRPADFGIARPIGESLKEIRRAPFRGTAEPFDDAPLMALKLNA